jgi:hypothetical protein
LVRMHRGAALGMCQHKWTVTRVPELINPDLSADPDVRPQADMAVVLGRRFHEL